MISDLLDLLRAGGAHEVGAEELADVLWLAQHVLPGPPEPADTGPGPGPGSAPGRSVTTPAAPAPQPTADAVPGPRPDPVVSPPPAGTRTPPGDDPAPEARTDEEPVVPPRPPRRRPALHVRGRAAKGALPHLAASVHVPAEAALPHSLELARALKPLTRKVPSPTAFELDEEATVARLVDENIMIPVLRSRPSRWLTLTLVVDTGPSMSLWSNEVREFEQSLARLGAFRDVRRWNLSAAEDSHAVELRPHPSVGRQPRHHREIVEPTGSQLIVVLSDTVGSIWRTGAAQRLLFDWAGRSQVAVAHLLPASLWNRGGATPAPASLRIPQPGAPNARWKVVLPHRAAARRQPGLAVPVVELEPEPLRTWANMTAGSGRWTWTSALLLPQQPAGSRRGLPLPPPDVPPTAEEVIHRFRSSSSPKSWQLAGYLSALSTVTLPVARLVQQAMLSDSTRSELAEVFLGGLLHRLPDPAEATDPAEAHFVFAPEVRHALLDAQYSKDVSEVQAVVRDRVSAHLEARYGHPRHFRAALTGLPPHRATVPYVGDAFATPSQEGLTRLGETRGDDGLVFVSYAEADRSWARLIADVLRQVGYEVDLELGRLSAGDDWSLGLNRALEQGRTVAVYSNAYFGPARSAPVDSWTEVAVRWTSRLIPVAVEEVFVPYGLKPVPDSPTAPGPALPQMNTRMLRDMLLRALEGPTLPPWVWRDDPEGEADVPGGTVRPTAPFASRDADTSTDPSFRFGRERELSQIDERLADGGGVVTLVGPAGVGKTTLALQYARATRDRYDITFWVQANGRVPIVDQLAELAAERGFVAADAPHWTAVSALQSRLRRTERWLLVFDGADDVFGVIPYVPTDGAGHVVITSRSTLWDSFFPTMVINRLTYRESVSFLRAEGLRGSAASRLALALDGLPSALLEAVAAVRNMSVDRFLEQRSRRGDGPSRRPDS